MNKAELAAYLVSLTALLDSFDDSAVQRPAWVAEEHKRVWGEFKAAVEADKERKS